MSEKPGYINFAVMRALALGAAIACILCSTACKTTVSKDQPVKTEIVTDPSGARIEINGEYVGDTPVKFAFQQDAIGDVIGTYQILATPTDPTLLPESDWLGANVKVPPKMSFRLKPPAVFVASNDVPDPSTVPANPSASTGVLVPQRPDVGRAATDLLTLLDGCLIVANDGQPLGVITQNEFAANSILNEFGKYGSEFSATSIFNHFGKYGSEFSQLSPFNEFTSTPPQIISSSGQFVAYLTRNKFKTPAIDPHALIGLLKSAN